MHRKRLTISEDQARAKLLAEYPERPGVEAYAVVRKSLKGPALGVGLTVEEAVGDAMFWLRATDGDFDRLMVVAITRPSYHAVLQGWANEWKMA